MVRDAMLAVAARLDERIGGPSFRDLEIVKAPGTPAILYVSRSTPWQPLGSTAAPSTAPKARGGRSSLLDAFDCPDPSTTAPRRAPSRPRRFRPSR